MTFWSPMTVEIHYFSLVFIILTTFFIIFHCFFNYMVEHRYIDTVYIDACIYTAGLEVIMQPWWKDMDFKKKQAYCVRIPGGILTLFNPQTHLKNPGRPSVIFQYFEDVFIIFQWFSLFWRCVSLIFHYFEDGFHYFEDGFHYFSMGFMILRSFWLLSIIVHWFFIIVHWFFIIFKTLLIIFMDVSLFLRCVSLFFIDFSMLLHVFHWFFSVLKAFFMIFHYVLGFFCNLHAYSAYLQCHIHGRHGTVENALRILEF